jgi:hypothetical protein
MMIPTKIEGCTRVMGSPTMMEDECADLEIKDEQCPIWGNRMLSAWHPTPEERIAIANGAPVILSIVGERHPVVAVYAGGWATKEVPADG